MESELPRTLELYLEHKAINTRRSYRYILKHFAGYGKILGHPDILSAFKSVSTDDVLDYFRQIRSTVLPDGTSPSDATITHHLTILSSVCHWLQDEGTVTRNPFRRARHAMPRGQKVQKRPTVLIPYPKALEIMSLPDVKTKKGRRDKALLSILFGCGLRESEATGLRLGDIRIDAAGNMYLILQKTKGGKRQEQPIPRWAWENIAPYVSQRKAEGADEHGPLFVSYYKETLEGCGEVRSPLSTKTLYRTFRRYCGRVGIKAAPHSARATAATKLKADGHEDRKVAEFLRHSSTRQVEIYDKRVKNLADNIGLTLDFSSSGSLVKRRAR